MPQRRTWTLLALVLLAVGVLLYAWQPWKKAESGPQYRLAKLERGPLSAAVTASGTLSALITVQVGSQVSGQIKEIRVDFNSEVKKDQVIARLDPETFDSRVAQAEADLKAAESAAEVARGNLAVRQAEVGKARSPWTTPTAQSGTQTRPDRSRTSSPPPNSIPPRPPWTPRGSSCNLAQADAAVAQRPGGQRPGPGGPASARRLKQARLDLDRTIIRSPVDGVVISRNVDVGQTVAASFQAPVLFTIARDLRQMEVNVAVDEADVGRVATGQKMRFSVDAFPGERFMGQVTQIRKAPITSNNVVTYSVMARVENPDLKLLPGMTASARILTEERKDVLKLPNEALRFRPVQADGTPIKLEVRGREEGPGIPGRVWVLKEGKPAPINVRLGVSDGKATEMLKGELQAGREIILGVEEASLNKAAKPNRPFGMGM
jgi:HlyD family secretion protein